MNKAAQKRRPRGIAAAALFPGRLCATMRFDPLADTLHAAWHFYHCESDLNEERAAARPGKIAAGITALSLRDTSGVSAGGRIAMVDILRGLALLAMAAFHFSWDLEFFGYLAPGAASAGAAKWIARGIASSFLLLCGIGLVLAHGKGIRWRPFGRRLAIVAGAAALVTAASYVAFPNGFIFFGILHQIALGSLIGLAFLRTPPLATLACAAAAVAAPHFLRQEFFDAPWLWWAGLSPVDPVSNDYVPVLPWTGAVLAGVALGRMAERYGVFEMLRVTRRGQGKGGGFLAALGRRSLAFYLLHQPLLIGAVYLFSLAYPAPGSGQQAYQRACNDNCRLSQSPPFCEAFCTCVQVRLENIGAFDKLVSGALDPQSDAEVQASARQCTAEAMIHEP